MVKKKRVVKKKTNKKPKIVSKIEKNKVFSTKVGLGVVLKNLSIFIFLFLISLALYATAIPKESGFSILFGILAIISFLISMAFFLALLALLVLKWMKR